MNRSEIVEGGRQHLKAYRHSAWCAYQVQPPTEEAPPLGRTPTQVCTRVGSVQLAASVSSHALAHRNGQAIHYESFSFREELAHQLGDVLQPLSKEVYSPGEARGAYGFGDIVHVVHHKQASLMIVVEVH